MSVSLINDAVMMITKVLVEDVFEFDSEEEMRDAARRIFPVVHAGVTAYEAQKSRQARRLWPLDPNRRPMENEK